MQNKKFENGDDIEKFLKDFFDSLGQEYFKKAFDEILRRWKKIIEEHGEYIVDLIRLSDLKITIIKNGSEND